MTLTVTDRYKLQSSRVGKAPPVVTEVYAWHQWAGIVVSGSGTAIRVAGDATSHFSNGDVVCVMSRGIATEYTIGSAPAYSSSDDWTTLTLSGFTYSATEDLYSLIAYKFSLVSYLAQRPIARIRQSVESQTLNVFDTGTFKVSMLDPDRDLYNEITEDGFFNTTDRIWITVKLGYKGLTETNERPIIIGGVVDPSGTTWSKSERSLTIQVYGYMKDLDHKAAYECSNAYGPMVELTGVQLVRYYAPLDGSEVYYGPKNLAYVFPDGEATEGVDIVRVSGLDMRTGGRVFKYVHPNRYQWDYGDTVLVQDEDDVNSDGDKNLYDYAGNRAIFNFGRPTAIAKNPNYHTADIVWIDFAENGTQVYEKGLPTLTFDSGRKAEAIPDFNAVIVHDSDTDTWTDRTNQAAIPGTPFDLLGSNDTLYLGDNERFGGVYFDIQDPASGDFSIKVYYSKGPGNWVEIPEADPDLGIEGYVDGTERFSVDGWITWQMPEDWRPVTIVDENDPDADFGWAGLYFVKIETEADYEIPETPYLEVAATFGESGTGEGQMNQPKGIWADEDYIYVADATNGTTANKVLIYTNDPPDGCTWVADIQTEGSGFVIRSITGDGTYIYVHGSNGNFPYGVLTKAYLKTAPYTFAGYFDYGSSPSQTHRGIVASHQDRFDMDDKLFICREGGNNDVYITNKSEDTTETQPEFIDAGDRTYDLELCVEEEDGLFATTVWHLPTTEDRALYKYDWADTESVIWRWGRRSDDAAGPGQGNEDPENGWIRNVRGVSRQHYPDRDGYICITSGVAAEQHMITVLKDNGATVEYYDHQSWGISGDYDEGFITPDFIFWCGEYLFVTMYSLDHVAVIGPGTPTAGDPPVAGTCNRVQKIIGLVGKRGDQLNVMVDIPNIPGESVNQQVIIKHDVDENNTVIPVPATWYQLMSAHGLIQKLLVRGGYAPGIQHIDDLNLEIDTAQIFGYGGRCPHLTARHPISAMTYDSSSGYLYVASGLEIWRVKGDTEFEHVYTVPRPGYTDPVEGSDTGWNYETTWSEDYQIVVLALETVSGNLTLRGLAIHPYKYWCWSQYTCPGIAFQYDIDDAVLEIYTYDLKNAAADDYYYGVWPGTHIVRPGRDQHIDGEASGTYQRMTGQWTEGGAGMNNGENISLPFGQLVTCGKFKYNGAQYLFSGMQSAAGLVSRGVFFMGLYMYIGRDVSTIFTGAKGYPWIYLPAGFYSHWDHFPINIHKYPARLRYTFGQEGFLEYESATGSIHQQRFQNIETNGSGCVLHSAMYRHRIGDDTWHADGPKYLRWHRKGVDTQVLCGCLGIDDYRYIAVMQIVEMGYGETSMAALRVISYKDEGFFFVSSGAPNLQRPGVAYWYNSASGWTDSSSDLASEDAPSYTVELDSTDDYLYLGMAEQFLSVQLEFVDPTVSGTMEIQIWTGSAWETMSDVGSDESSERRYFDGTYELSASGVICIHPPFNSADKQRWTPSTFYNLTNPGTQTQVSNTDEFYWIRIRMSSISSNTVRIDRVYSESVVVWDNWIYDDGGHKGYTILNLCDGDSSSSNHIIHGALWDRDDGAETGDLDALQYFYFVLDIDSSGVTMVKSQSLSDATDTSNSQFMGHVFDPHSDKVYSVLAHPLYKDRGAILVSATYNGSTITLTRLDNLQASDWGISGKLLATGTGRIYGVTHPRGILFHYDTEVYPRVTIANFGQGMSIRQAITYLCEITNTVFRISPEREAYVQKRDHSIASGNVLQITEPEHLVKINGVETWPHQYDGVHVDWTDIYGENGTEISGSSEWGAKVLQLTNPFVQDMYVADAMAQVYDAYFQVARMVVDMAVVFMPWLELKDVFRLFVSSTFGCSDRTVRWSISELGLDMRKNSLDVKALVWDGEET